MVHTLYSVGLLTLVLCCTKRLDGVRRKYSPTPKEQLLCLFSSEFSRGLLCISYSGLVDCRVSSATSGFFRSNHERLQNALARVLNDQNLSFLGHSHNTCKHGVGKETFNEMIPLMF